MNNELTRNMYRLQSFANPLVFNSLAKKKFIFYIVIYNILYNFATDWIHLLGRDIFEMLFISTHIYRGVEKMYVTLI